MPLATTWITRPPMTASVTRPLPPKRLVPPITAAPTANSTVPLPPVWTDTELLRLAISRPATAASEEHIMKQEIFTHATLMPARRAASALPPTAYTWRPQDVLFRR